jgi:hypothetical protein
MVENRRILAYGQMLLHLRQYSYRHGCIDSVHPVGAKPDGCVRLIGVASNKEESAWERRYAGASATVSPLRAGWLVQIRFATGQKIALVEAGTRPVAQHRADTLVGSTPAGPWQPMTPAGSVDDCVSR